MSRWRRNSGIYYARKKIVISELVIREVLHFKDQPNSPVEIPIDQIREVLDRMGYEGTFPPTMKKFIHPYWCFLAHAFIICISCRKGRADEISLSSTSVIVAVIIDLDFKISKYNHDDDGISPTETEGDTHILKLPSQSAAQMDEFIAQLDSTARIPPQAVVTPTITPSDHDLCITQASQPPLKRRRTDPRPGVLVREQVQHVQQPITTTKTSQTIHVESPILDKGLVLLIILLKQGALQLLVVPLHPNLHMMPPPRGLLVSEHNEAKVSQSSPAQASQDSQDAPQHVSTTRIVDRFEMEPAQADPRVIQKRARKQAKTQGKRSFLFMKNSNKSVHGDQALLSVIELEKKRSKPSMETGCSWTKVDLIELVEAPFHNPSNDPHGTNFKLFLENQIKKKFDGMTTAESFVKKTKGVIDPSTNC
ncbi:unnamed protein product [Lactuca saligna]|uniref:Uncharacterized protein n=1 Tax=Lactuca saligna TaxID=75948 RepID=A0AA35V3P2_LACSI|nr:unnamed protein product [Lactuca saligna]